MKTLLTSFFLFCGLAFAGNACVSTNAVTTASNVKRLGSTVATHHPYPLMPQQQAHTKARARQLGLIQ